MLLFHRGDQPGAEVMPESDFLSGSGFGVLPAAARSGARVQVQPGQQPLVSTGSVRPPQDICTVDGGLIYQNWAWRVRDPSTTCASTLPSSDETSQYIYDTKQHIYVGAFPIDLANTNGQITTIDNPAAIGSDWGDWLAGALDSIAQAYASAKSFGLSIINNPDTAPEQFRVLWMYGSTRMYNAHARLYSMLPRVVGATQDYYDNGTPGGAPFTTNEQALANGCADPQIAKNVLSNVHRLTQPYCLPPDQPITFPEVKAKTASGGHALHPTKAWFVTDNNGNRVTAVQYDDDPNTYWYYNYAQWLAAISPKLLDGLWTLINYRYLKPSNTVEYNRSKNFPPVAKFKYPAVFGNAPFDAGLWLSLGPRSGNLTSKTPSEGDWDTEIDGPSGHIMQIAMGPLPEPGLLDEIENALLWIPSQLANLVGGPLVDLSAWVESVLCNPAKAQAAIAQDKDPTTRAEMQAAYLAASQICPAPNPVNCVEAPNSPQCVIPQPAKKPWWQNWWVWGIGVAAAATIMVANEKKKSTTTSAAKP